MPPRGNVFNVHELAELELNFITHNIGSNVHERAELELNFITLNIGSIIRPGKSMMGNRAARTTTKISLTSFHVIT